MNGWVSRWTIIPVITKTCLCLLLRKPSGENIHKQSCTASCFIHCCILWDNWEANHVRIQRSVLNRLRTSCLGTQMKGKTGEKRKGDGSVINLAVLSYKNNKLIYGETFFDKLWLAQPNVSLWVSSPGSQSLNVWSVKVSTHFFKFFLSYKVLPWRQHQIRPLAVINALITHPFRLYRYRENKRDNRTPVEEKTKTANNYFNFSRWRYILGVGCHRVIEGGVTDSSARCHTQMVSVEAKFCMSRQTVCLPGTVCGSRLWAS